MREEMALTEVPLPAAQDLEQASDECADDEVRSPAGDVEHPDEADERVRHL